MNQYSEYSATLRKEVFGRYHEKLTLTNRKAINRSLFVKRQVVR